MVSLRVPVAREQSCVMADLPSGREWGVILVLLVGAAVVVGGAWGVISAVRWAWAHPLF